MVTAPTIGDKGASLTKLERVMFKSRLEYYVYRRKLCKNATKGLEVNSLEVEKDHDEALNMNLAWDIRENKVVKIAKPKPKKFTFPDPDFLSVARARLGW